MKVAVNSILASAGYLPAGVVAKLLGKQVVSMHRLVEAGRVVAARDGSALYISARSLSDYYRAGGAIPVADAVLELLSRVQEAVRARDAALAIGCKELLKEKDKSAIKQSKQDWHAKLKAILVKHAR